VGPALKPAADTATVAPVKRQSLTDPRPGMTKRQTEVIERLELGITPKRIARDIGTEVAVVERTIRELRAAGHLPEATANAPSEG
jgi:DNA-binding NarL/FixJ family response regulator